MKDRIADKARVMESDKGLARVRLVGGHTCRKCGLAAMGLCKPGGTGMEIIADDPLGTSPGDMVMLAMDDKARWKGYTLAYIVPLAALLTGGAAGHAIGLAINASWPEVALAALFFAIVSPLALGRLRRLDSAQRLYISRIIREVPDFDSTALNLPEARDYMVSKWSDRHCQQMGMD